MVSKKKLESASEKAEKTMSKFFSNVPENEEKVDDEKASHKKDDAQKAKKKSFSFRGDPEKVDGWRVYAIAKGITVDTLGEKALDEYIKKHKLNDAEKAVYKLKLSQRKK